MVKRRASEGLTGHRPERRKPGGSWWVVQGGLGSELHPGGLGSLGILSVCGSGGVDRAQTLKQMLFSITFEY